VYIYYHIEMQNSQQTRMRTMTEDKMLLLLRKSWRSTLSTRFGNHDSRHVETGTAIVC